MSLSDIMSAAGLAGYAEAGLVIFLLTFVVIAIRTLAKSNDPEWERERQLPLCDEDSVMHLVPGQNRREWP
jgi:hypothetical protein